MGASELKPGGPSPHVERGAFGISAPVRIATIYLAFSLVWIFGSDYLVALLFDASDRGRELALRAQTLKGSLFVIVTGLMLWWLIRGHTRRLENLNASLSESEARLRRLLADIPVPVCLVRDGRFKYLNAAARELLGDDPALEGTPLEKRVHQTSRTPVETLLNRVKREERTIELEHQRLIGAGERELDVLMVARPSDADPGSFELVLIDNTERRRLESIAAQANRQEAVGAVAAGFTHNFNNLLTAIMGQVQLARRDGPVSAEVEHSLTTIDELARHGAGVTRSLLSFARLSKPDRHVVAVAPLVRSLEPLVRGLMPTSIAVDIDTAGIDDSASALIDEGQFKHVIINLAINARDAVRARGNWPGQIVLRVREMVRSTSAELPANRRILITVSDNGVGIAPEVMPELFRPFFSTKPHGMGSGLGLPITRSIVEDHDGEITVESTLGVGTTFSVSLPECETAPPAGSANPAAAPSVRRGTVIVGEDNPAIRRFVSAWLRTEGYQVLEAETRGAVQGLLGAPPTTEQGVVALVLGGILAEKGTVQGKGGLAASSVPIVLIAPGSTPPAPGSNTTLLPTPFSPRDLIEAVRRFEPESQRI